MAQLSPTQARDYMVGRGQLNGALLGWTDGNGQGWKVSVISVTAGDAGMMTSLRLRFEPIILITLIADPTRDAQEFDIAVSARETSSGSIAPASWA